MRRSPKPRKQIYDIYWYFAAERLAAFRRRISGQPRPWTDDPILSAFKFCNTYRAADRVSQFLIGEVAYHEEPCTAEDRLFQIVAFRVFSNIETWRTVVQVLGRQPRIADLKSGAFLRALETARCLNGRLYTGAFILCAADAYGRRAKHRNHVALFEHMFVEDKVGSRLGNASTFREIYETLHSYPLFGDFMAYQIAVDLNYSDALAFSENDFTQPGPGAIRGLRKVFEDLGDYTPADAIMWTVERQEFEFKRLGLQFDGLWGRPLHAIDCQGLFCETDKYCREAVPELTSARKRIKARFTPSGESIRLFFPPKWGINDKLPSTRVLGGGGSSARQSA